MNLLNLGCGYEKPEGWENVDKEDYGGHVIGDVLKGLPYPDNYFDFVAVVYTLQMFTYDELPIVLEEVRRVMKNGATLRILVPDIMLLINKYVVSKGLGLKVPIDEKIESTKSGRLLRYIFWHGDTRSAFSQESLEDLLKRNGFKYIRQGRFGECDLDNRKEESLIMEGKK